MLANPLQIWKLCVVSLALDLIVLADATSFDARALGLNHYGVSLLAVAGLCLIHPIRHGFVRWFGSMSSLFQSSTKVHRIALVALLGLLPIAELTLRLGFREVSIAIIGLIVLIVAGFIFMRRGRRGPAMRIAFSGLREFDASLHSVGFIALRLFILALLASPELSVAGWGFTSLVLILSKPD